jgi:hypothetical protein
MTIRNARTRTFVTLVLAAFAVLGSVHYSTPAGAQETKPDVKCWIESCTGNTCVRVQIQCPKEIIPVTDG